MQLNLDLFLEPVDLNIDNACIADDNRTENWNMMYDA